MSSSINQQILVNALLWKGLSNGQRVLLSLMCCHASSQGQCYLQLSEIAEMQNIHKCSVSRDIKKLKELGLVYARKRGLYSINLTLISADFNSMLVKQINAGVNLVDATVNENDHSGKQNVNTTADLVNRTTNNDQQRSVCSDVNSINHGANLVSAGVNSVNPIVNSREEPYISYDSINTNNVLIEKEAPSLASPPATPPAKKRKRSPRTKTTFPAGFTITEDMWNWYAKQGGFVLPIEQATETWSDAMRAKGLKYLDWRAAWRNGMKNQNKWEKRDREQGQQRTHTDIANAYARQWCDEHGVPYEP
ncbi:helix-turn-helix domain-containing protein [Sansalvadorimonas verongulae]|uniref:helix-turn-helix domain-containing protein n=1 Tax=Sansalvadorimonas verongulae TaxID=2172824 RepID=UPI0012BC33D4|nr:helix-turn-helix domain-containing protein [Sansalvadorimonas verongulae]MTI12415.1 hypothetical protein [Sansalvadorimonas verongulae]